MDGENLIVTRFHCKLLFYLFFSTSNHQSLHDSYQNFDTTCIFNVYMYGL